MRSAPAAVLLAAAALVPALAPAADAGTLRGDAQRGREIVASRQTGLCLLCHSGPLGDPRLQGNLAPDLGGVGSRLTESQLRERIVDPARANPDSLMPAYARTSGLARVAPARAGMPILDAQQVEDVVAFLATLK